MTLRDPIVAPPKVGYAAVLFGTGTATILPPTITDVSPAAGTSLGGTPVTVTGTEFFAGIITITFDGVEATSVVALNNTTATCVTPAGTAGAAVDVVVTTVGGSDTLVAGYTYHPLPTVTSITPNTGPSNDPQAVTIGGTGFLNNSPGTNVVAVDGNPVTSLVVVSDISITCNVPVGTEGPAVDVVVTNDNGTGTLVGGYTYLAPDPLLAFPAVDYPLTNASIVELSLTTVGEVIDIDSGLRHWFDCSDVSTQVDVGDDTESIVSKASPTHPDAQPGQLAITLQQTVAEDKPDHLVTLGGKRVLRFAREFFETSANYQEPPWSCFTVFLLFRQVAGTPDAVDSVLHWGLNPGFADFSIFFFNENLIIQIGNGLPENRQMEVTSWPPTIPTVNDIKTNVFGNSWKLLTVQYNSVDFRMWLDGGDWLKKYVPPSPMPLQNLDAIKTLADRKPDPESQLFARVADLMIWGGPLSAAQKNRVTEYINSKWSRSFAETF